jgi:cytochrome c
MLMDGQSCRSLGYRRAGGDFRDSTEDIMDSAWRLTAPVARKLSIAIAVAAALLAARAQAQTGTGDPVRGAQLFGACAACHSTTRDRNMTGPSLYGVWDRKAGTLPSFPRYSSALKASGVVWDEKTLDAWLASPARFIPGNHMTFAGVTDALQRADLIAYLKAASSGQAPPTDNRSDGMMGGMAPQFQDLKKVGPDRQVRAVSYCGDTYRVTTADGNEQAFWEANLRFKTDSGDTGPLKGTPVILPAGMMGDRASVFFAAPEEISAFIKHQC